MAGQARHDAPRIPLGRQFRQPSEKPCVGCVLPRPDRPGRFPTPAFVRATLVCRTQRISARQLRFTPGSLAGFSLPLSASLPVTYTFPIDCPARRRWVGPHALAGFFCIRTTANYNSTCLLQSSSLVLLALVPVPRLQWAFCCAPAVRDSQLICRPLFSIARIRRPAVLRALR